MFERARIKLTIWYLLIIMLISVMFSLAIYRILTGELDNEVRHVATRYLQEFGPIPPGQRIIIESNAIEGAENRIKYSLIYINLVILGVAGIGGYILAGITLKPIKNMIEEQKRFITDASHELRTPLTSLKSEIEVYLRSKQHTIKESDVLLKSNLEEVNKLQYLSDSLIQLANPSQPQNTKALTKVSLKNVLEKAKIKYEMAAKQKNIIIQVSEKDYSILGNQDNLVQLFGIFIDNAIKYSPQKSIVRISMKKTDPFIQVSITDKGIGIAEKDISHIFDRFFRADISRTKQNVSGYGLGLSIAKDIVKSIDGEIAVKSNPGKGTTFTINLPVSG